jgi:serine/threonine-protein kinase
MGEVYRAVDTILGRAVAVKVLPDAFATDGERLARFEREARTLAALNHPNIATIHGLERAGSVQAIVMELVEGPTLADRIAEGPVPLDEALRVAKQIAEALEAAHEQGIVHRDLKPANIKVKADGTVKVLDFGLAKTAEATGVGSSAVALTQSPTITTPAMTQAGMILGTAAYMSPEQAKGKAADRRSDIWAFGAVLYEMLTGRRAFAGPDVSDTLVAIFRDEPDWSALPPNTPATVRTLLAGCLDKNAAKRVQHVAAAVFALGESALAARPPIADPPQRSAKMRRRTLLIAAAAFVVGAMVVGGAVWLATQAPPRRVLRTTLMGSGPAALTINGNDRDVAVAPDGARVIYVAANGSQLLVRALDTLDPTVIVTGQPRGPFASPDGQSVGFWDIAEGAIKKVSLTGGPAAIVTPAASNAARGATWLADDTIVFASTGPDTGLMRAPASGGPSEVLTRPNQQNGELDHQWPESLPGGSGLLFTVVRNGGLENAQIAVLDLATGDYATVLNGGSHARYSASGHLIYVAGTQLRAVRFDIDRLQVVGSSVPVVPRVATTAAGAGTSISPRTARWHT